MQEQFQALNLLKNILKGLIIIIIRLAYKELAPYITLYYEP